MASSSSFGSAVRPGGALMLVVWALASTSANAVSQEASTGSLVPCAVPLAWHIGSIDGRFGITESRALTAARAAASLWEEAVGRTLFAFGGASSAPIVFEFDERQAGLESRGRVRDGLDRARENLEARRLEIQAATAALDSVRFEYEPRAEAHRRAMNAYNADVARWNERGGAPEDVVAALQARLAELDRERESLSALEVALRTGQERLSVEIERFNRDVDEHQGAEDRFQRDFPIVAAESGRYDERVTRQDDEVRSITRRIRVFQFRDDVDLVLVLAHEFGHALGLGHTRDAGAIMTEVIVSGDDRTPRRTVSETDVRMLRARCPHLVPEPLP